MRTLKELLEILLAYYVSDDYEPYIINGNKKSYGLCYATVPLRRSKSITITEERKMDHLFMTKAKDSDYYLNGNPAYLFKMNDKESRIAWLKEQIKSM